MTPPQVSNDFCLPAPARRTVAARSIGSHAPAVSPACLEALMTTLARKNRVLTGVIARIRREDAGMTTVEYAVGTVAAAGFGGLLIKLLMSDEARNLIWGLISNALSALFG
jgi:hypothetical protein